MKRLLFVHLLPALFEPAEVRGSVTVILDILRASTTIVHALAHGARAVVPTLEIADALAARDRYPVGSVLLGGEREGIHIDGFDCDNNPFAYTPELVAHKTVVFTTTNGTRALLRAQEADRILIGSFVNLTALVQTLADDHRPIHLVCAGTRGKVSQEDVLCAGAILDGLLAEFVTRDELLTDDQAQLALHRFLAADSTEDGLLQAVRNSYGGRNCRKLRYDTQIARAATRDLFTLVPEWDRATGELRGT